MFQIVLVVLVFGSPKALDPCAPQIALTTPGLWDGTRFVKAEIDAFRVSDDGYYWQTIAPFPVEVDYYATVNFQTNGQVYLWSDNSDSYVSQDLLHWTELDIPGGRFLWNGSQWLVYGGKDTATSADGLHWQIKTDAFSDGAFEIVFFKDRYLSSGSPLMTSVDGLNWSSLNLDAYGTTVLGDKVMAYNGGQLFISDNGLNWTLSLEAPEYAYFSSMAYNGQTYLATARPYLYLSSDGTNWTQRELPAGIDAVHANGTSFFSTNTVYSSNDGVDWRPQAYYAQYYLAVDDTVYFESGYLKNGVFFEYLNKVAFKCLNGLYFTTGLVYMSHNGIGWRRLPFYGEVFYNTPKARWESCTSGTRNISYDGLTWVSEAVPEMDNFAYIVNGRYFQSGMTSSDGYTWVRVPLQPNGIIWTGRFYMGLFGDRVYRSSDGITWARIQELTSAGKLWAMGDVLMASVHTGVLISLDHGEHWARPLSNLVGISNAGVYNDHFVAFGVQNLMYTSTDGLLWEKRTIGLEVEEILGNTSNALIVADEYVASKLECFEGTPIEPIPVTIFPWVVANQSWYSRLGLTNYDGNGISVRLEAEDREGNTQSVIRIIPAYGLLTELASDMFPGLNGYSVSVQTSLGTYHSGLGALSGSLTTFNVNPIAGTPSPAQADASLVGELSDELLFAYLPGDDVPAIALENVAPNATEIQVLFSLIDEQGTVLAEVEHTLTGKRPFASTFADLFPGIPLPQSGAVRAKGPEQAWLSGLTFDFNHLGQPAMDRAFNLHTP